MDKIKILKKVIPDLYSRLKSCDLCPRNCSVNRLKGEIGYCGIGKEAVVYTTFLHQGEEPGISVKEGSGTIFFSGCNLKCVYCQNHKFSHSSEGQVANEHYLAKIMLNLQKRGAVNINLVTPTHVLPQILKGLLLAYEEGLNLPIVYNTSGYEKLAIIELLRDIVDIYLADIRYARAAIAKEYSQAQDYPLYNPAILKEMDNQKRILWARDILKSGLVLRHLVLPGHVKESIEIIHWIKNNIKYGLTSLMFQYQPYFKSHKYPKINRKINVNEYMQIKEEAEALELDGWVQDLTPQEDLAGVHFKPSLLE